MGHHFDSVALPDYNGIEGAYNAKINAETGAGEYVIHSGGVGKTRVYDAVGNSDGDIFMIGYTQSSVVNWGGTLQTKIIEEEDDQNDDAGTAFQMGKVSSNTKEYQFFAVKLAAASPATPSCVESCSLEDGKVANPVIKAGSCLIDNVCYDEGATADFFGRPCQVCDPSESGSQTEWSFGDTVGELVCFIDNVCYDVDDYYSYRESRSTTHTSLCQHCSPRDNAFDWSIDTDNYVFVSGVEPLNDCLNKTAAPTESPVEAEKDPVKDESTSSFTPAVESTKVEFDFKEEPAKTSDDEEVGNDTTSGYVPATTSEDVPADASISADEGASADKNDSASNVIHDNASDEFSLNKIAGIVSALVVTMLF
mmetsp:Transcript_25748/g.46454  ORF Transcript_25748/g.46454 Transcript_25748/m.46454 type:complete len:366 (+) Transcript_25748:1692-2789(+)